MDSRCCPAEAATGSTELREVHAEGVGVGVGFDLLPGDGVAGFGGLASHDAGSGGLDAGGDLVLEFAADDALDEVAVLHGIGLGEIVGEVSVGGEVSGGSGRVSGPCPGLGSTNLEGTAVGSVGEALRAEEALGDIEEVVLVELGGGEAELDSVGIGEDHLVVVRGVACVLDDLAAALRVGGHWVCPHDPVADVDDVDVLLEKNVAGEVAVEEPVAQAVLIGSRRSTIDHDGGRRVIERRDLRDLSDLARVNAANQLDEGRRGADLEADGHADLAVLAAADLECTAGLGNVDADGLLAVGVLACGG